MSINVFSATDYDVVNYQTGQVQNCPIGGIAQLNFQYTPQTGDKINFLVYQQGLGGYKQCSGSFTQVKATGLGSDQTVSIISIFPLYMLKILYFDSIVDIFYDVPAAAGASSFYAQAVVCASSNSTCTGTKRFAFAPLFLLFAL